MGYTGGLRHAYKHSTPGTRKIRGGSCMVQAPYSQRILSSAWNWLLDLLLDVLDGLLLVLLGHGDLDYDYDYGTEKQPCPWRLPVAQIWTYPLLLVCRVRKYMPLRFHGLCRPATLFLTSILLPAPSKTSSGPRSGTAGCRCENSPNCKALQTPAPAQRLLKPRRAFLKPVPGLCLHRRHPWSCR